MEDDELSAQHRHYQPQVLLAFQSHQLLVLQLAVSGSETSLAFLFVGHLGLVP